MINKTFNTLNKFALINGGIGSVVCGTKMAYEFQKDETTNSGKIISGSLGATIGSLCGFTAGVILTYTSPITVPILVYDKYST